MRELIDKRDEIIDDQINTFNDVVENIKESITIRPEAKEKLKGFINKTETKLKGFINKTEIKLKDYSLSLYEKFTSWLDEKSN